MANSRAASPWMPPQGRFPVNIGSSLGRAIKNRKLKGSPAPTAKRSNLPEREFYSFKFNFKPSSIDATKPASIDIKKGPEQSQVQAEYPSTQAGQVYPFSGNELPAKDVDCILIYDEDTGQYTIEKIDSFILLKSDRVKAASPRIAMGSPAAAATPTPSNSSAKGKTKEEEYDGMAVDRSPADQDADGEADVEMEDIPPAIAYREEEEEAEEGEEIELPRRTVSPPKPLPKPARAVKPIPKARVVSKALPVVHQPPPPPPPAAIIPPVVKKASPPPPKAKPQPKPKKAKHVPTPTPAPALPVSYPDEEVIEFTRPAKRARPSPPPRKPPVLPPAPVAPAPVSLSLPGGSSAFAPPPAPVPPWPSASSRNIPAPTPKLPSAPPSMPASPQMVASDSEDDEEEWEQVQTTTTVASLPITAAAGTNATDSDALEADIFGDTFEEIDGDQEEEIDVHAFEQELNEQMEDEGSEDDFLAAAVSPEPEQQTRQPMSLNRFADGAAPAANYSDDDFSSSDESDDD